MSDIDDPREIRLHFVGENGSGDAVPAKVLINALDHVQRIIHLLAKLQHGEELGRRIRVSREIAERYSLMCKIPQEGSYVVPTEIGVFSHESRSKHGPVEQVKRSFLEVTRAVDQGDFSRLEKVVPDTGYRTSLIKEYKAIQPSKELGLVCSIEDGRGRKVLDGFTALSAIAEIDTLPACAPEAPAIHYVTGHLVRMDFRKRTLRIKPLNGPHLDATYSDNLESDLLHHPRGLIQVRGEVTYDEHQTPTSLANAESIIRVDENRIEVRERVIVNVRYRIEPPLCFTVQFDPSSCLYDLKGELGVNLFAETRPELEDALYAEIELLWTEYAQEEPHRLSPAALALRNVLLSRFRESRDDS